MPETITRRAADLRPGEVITVDGRMMRTVASVEPVTWTVGPSVVVHYRQGAVPGVWSAANVYGRDSAVTVHVGARHVIDYLRCSNRCGHSEWLDATPPGLHNPCPVCDGFLQYSHTVPA